MSALLYLPALLMCLNFRFGLIKTLASLVFLVAAQFVIGLEWILYKPEAYFGKAFEFDRVFFFKWSVNWQFWGERYAMSKELARNLLIAHLTLLVLFLLFRWTTSIRQGVGAWLREIRLHEVGLATKVCDLDPRYVALSMFTCNLIGILCARSLHYQFYSWYYQTLPLILLYIKKVPLLFKYDLLALISYRVLLLIAIELCWNVYPPQAGMSSLLFGCHVTLVLLCMYLVHYPETPYRPKLVVVHKKPYTKIQ